MRSYSLHDQLLSGKDGTTLRTRPWNLYRGIFWTITAAGDVDGDGIPDYAYTIFDQSGLGLPMLVEMRSGKDDRLLWSASEPTGVYYEFGVALLGNVDLNGDGRPDLLATAPFEGQYGTVYGFRHDGSLLFKLSGSPTLVARYRSHSCLGRIGDFDGDGAEDFLLGCGDTVVGLPMVAVVSGRTQQVLVRGYGPNPYETVGDSVAGCGDLDADGVLDFAASGNGGPGLLGVALAYSGRTGQPLFTWWGIQSGRGFGASLRGGGLDQDQDGLPDIVVGAYGQPVPGTGDGSVFVFSGRDDGSIHRVDNNQSNNTGLGTWLDVVPPSPVSPFPGFVLPEEHYGRYISVLVGCCPELGRIRMFRGTPAGAQVYGPSCQGALSSPPRIGLRDLAKKSTRVHLSNAPPGARGVLLLGLSRTALNGVPLPISLGQLGFPGCQLETSIELLACLPTGTSGTAAGYASVDLALPLKAGGAGTFAVHGQWIVGLPAAGLTGALSAPMEWLH